MNSMMQGTVSLTFCDSGENHVGMRMLGKKVDIGQGFNKADLLRAMENFKALGCECEFVDFARILENMVDNNINIPDGSMGSILIIRGGARVFGDINLMKEEMCRFDWDTKYWCNRRKKVLNKHARANVCFDSEACEADYTQGQGTIISWDKVSEVAKIRTGLKFMLGLKGQELVCEGNHYFNNKCGIGFHGDTERRKVVAVRLGEDMKMQWCWYYRHAAIGEKFEVTFTDGDMYIMDEKAVGTDWRKSSIFTLRHAAGAEKYLKEKRIEDRIEVVRKKLQEIYGEKVEKE